MSNPDAERDPGALILPFGKHKGTTVAELLAKDPAYADWVVAQAWVAQRFAELHAAILSRGAGSDDTPEHNTLQARFLDPAFRAACLRLTVQDRLQRDLKQNMDFDLEGPRRVLDRARERQASAAQRIKYARPDDAYFAGYEEAKKKEDLAVQEAEDALELAKANHPTRTLCTEVNFEQSGVDVTIAWLWSDNGPLYKELAFRGSGSGWNTTRIELKPSIGDDYPTIMRQMQRLQCSVLVAQTFCARGVSEPTLKSMLAANGSVLVFEREIEAEILTPHAR